MSYTLKFSDPSKSTSITVPEYPPGINVVDTSLNLIGKGYPNYGQKTAENFLHLLENFAGPFPGPSNPIEGQIWYDTSDPNHKVLRVRDGINWSNVSGIYQQSDDPRTSLDAPARLRAGDLWVDTSLYQLKIFNNNDWTLVGPIVTEGSQTGLTIDTLYSTTDIPNVSQGHPVIKLWAEGDVVAIITSRGFTPKSVIPGFTTLVPGINLRATAFGEYSPVPILNGTAKNATNLKINDQIIGASTVLLKDDKTRRSQVVTGQVFFRTPTESINNELWGQGDYGIVINNQSSNDDERYVTFYKGDSNAVILNNHPEGSIVLKVTDGLALKRAIEIDYSQTSKQFVTTVDTPLTVNNTASLKNDVNVDGDLTVASTATITGALTVSGTTIINDDLTVTGQIIVSTTTSIVPSVNGVYNIGSPSKYFKNIYVGSVGTSTHDTYFYGKLVGSATSLEYGTTFKLQGQATATSFVFSGTSVTATFDVSLTPSAVSSQTSTATTTDLTFLALNTSSNQLKKIKYTDLVGPLQVPGVITAYGANTTPPTGWLKCDGTAYSTSTYVDLYSVLGTSYGGSGGVFQVPNLSTAATTGTVYYIIKY